MTIDNGFPISYFYIVSKLNGMVIDVENPEAAQDGSRVVMAPKVEEKPARDTQLFIHQDGFLTNKRTGLVLDIDHAGTFTGIFTGEKSLFLDQMKEENADDQRFGYDAEFGHIYRLSDPRKVFDIKGSKDEAGTRVVMYKRKEEVEEAANQLWTIELADPPKPVDSDDEEEDDSKRARINAWFGSWWGWGRKKNEVLDERELEEANKKVYEEKKKSHFSYELLAGAAAFAAVKMWEHKREEDGQPMDHALVKQLIAGFAAAEITKLIQDHRTDDDDDDDDEDKKQKKVGIMQRMAISAATNYFESKYS
ncbi:hypothetical protein BX666DRAFT_1900932 [Dichotomocladium elegans]|nr:hypothetical protein BX666DRAFT_1900932 [Dichotomocladium elegans]